MPVSAGSERGCPSGTSLDDKELGSARIMAARLSLSALFATCLASFCREVCKVAVAAAVHWRRRVTVVWSTRWQEAVFFLDRSEGAAAVGDAVDHIPYGVVAADVVTPA